MRFLCFALLLVLSEEFALGHAQNEFRQRARARAIQGGGQRRRKLVRVRRPRPQQQADGRVNSVEATPAQAKESACPEKEGLQVRKIFLLSYKGHNTPSSKKIMK